MLLFWSITDPAESSQAVLHSKIKTVRKRKKRWHFYRELFIIIRAFVCLLWKVNITGPFFGSHPVVNDNLVGIFRAVPCGSESDCELAQQKYEMRESIEKSKKPKSLLFSSHLAVKIANMKHLWSSYIYYWMKWRCWWIPFSRDLATHDEILLQSVVFENERRDCRNCVQGQICDACF